MKKLACVLALLSGLGCSRARPLTVGSKNFTEQIVLGEIVAQQLERRLGGKVDRKLDLGGTLLADEHAHGMSVVAEAFQEFLGGLVKHGVAGDALHPLLELRRGGQLAVEKEVSDLQERA